MMWFRKIQRKKLQYSLVALILFFAAMILSGCLIFTVESSSYLTDFYKKGNLPDTYAIIKTEEAVNKVIDASKENEHITVHKVWDGVDVLNMYSINGEEKAAFFTYFYKISDYTQEVVDITISDGEDTKAPKDNEIWLSKVYADINDIKVGDIFTIQGKDYRVGAIFKSPMAPSSSVSILPAFCNEKTYEQMKINNAEIHMIFISSDDEKIEVSNEFVKDALKDQPDAISYVMSRKDLLDSIQIMGILFGGIGTMASIMIFVVSVVIIKYIIKSNISKEFGAIGIYKALGDSDKKIKSLYVKSFSFVGFIGITLGAVVGILISYFMYDSLLSNLSIVHFTVKTVFVIAGTILLLMLVLNINLRKGVNMVSKITPVEALRVGLTSTKKKLKQSFIKSAHSPLSVAINDIVKYKGNSVLIIILLSVSFFLSIFFINMKYSIDCVGDNGNKWFSLPKVDATISGDISDELMNYLRDSDKVESYQKGNLLANFDITGPDDCGIDFKWLICSVFEDASEETTKIPYSTGRGPENGHEIALSSKAIMNSSYKVGDFITLNINGYVDSFLITGIFNTMMNNGKAALLQADVYDLFQSSMKDNITYVFITLKKSDGYEDFKSDILAHVPNIAVNTIIPEVAVSADSVETMAAPICLVLVIVFILFSIINIINLLAMEQINNRKVYGILKSLGFSNSYICVKCLIKTMLLAAVSAIIALFIYINTARIIFLSAVGVDGGMVSVKDTTLIVGIILAFILIVTLLFCMPLRKIAPKDLMEE